MTVVRGRRASGCAVRRQGDAASAVCPRTRSLLAIVLLAGPVHALAQAPQCPQAILGIGVTGDGQRTAVIAGPADFAGVPTWDPGKGAAPIAPEQAIAAARAAIAKSFGAVQEMTVQGVYTKRAGCDELGGQWFYEVRFLGSTPGKSGFPLERFAVVLMDGRVLEPTPIDVSRLMVPAGASRPMAQTAGATPAPGAVQAPRRALAMDPMWPQEHYDGELAASALGNQAANLIESGKYVQLDAELTDLRERRERLPDGRSWYAVTMSGIPESVSGIKGYEAGLDDVRKWREGAPESPHAPIIEAGVWIRFAWDARGSGFADTVSAKGNELFRRRLGEARRLLEQSRALAGRNPYWYTSMLTVGLGESWPIERQSELFREAVASDSSFLANYFVMATQLTPRWGGGIDAFVPFVEGSVRSTAPTEGRSMYARLYWIYAGVESDRSFRSLGIPWTSMREGFDDLVARYPSPWNVNHYAWFACQAGDKATFVKLLPKLEPPNFLPGVWRGSYKFDVCRETFTDRS